MKIFIAGDGAFAKLSQAPAQAQLSLALPYPADFKAFNTLCSVVVVCVQTSNQIQHPVLGLQVC